MPAKPTARERADRNAQIALRRAEGATYTDLAEEFGIARSSIQRALSDHAEVSARVVAGAVVDRPGDLDVEAVFVRIVEGHAAVLDRMERLVEEADNDASRIGAARTFVSTGEGLLKILGLVGLLPHADQVLVARALRLRARGDAKDQAERLLVGGAS